LLKANKFGSTWFWHHIGILGTFALSYAFAISGPNVKQMDVLSWRILRKQFSRRPTGIDIFGGGGRTAKSSRSTSQGQQEQRSI
jgi:hypothetical protein